MAAFKAGNQRKMKMKVKMAGNKSKVYTLNNQANIF